MARRKVSTIAAHPGEILRTEFIEPMGITAYELAKAVHCPGIYEILREERGISADVALRLGKYFGILDESSSRLRPAARSGKSAADQDQAALCGLAGAVLHVAFDESPLL